MSFSNDSERTDVPAEPPKLLIYFYQNLLENEFT